MRLGRKGLPPPVGRWNALADLLPASILRPEAREIHVLQYDTVAEMPLLSLYLVFGNGSLQCVPQPALARTQRRRRCALGFLPAPGKIGKHENVLLQRNKSITVRPGYCAPYRSRSLRVPIIIGKPVAAWRVILVLGFTAASPLRTSNRNSSLLNPSQRIGAQLLESAREGRPGSDAPPLPILSLSINADGSRSSRSSWPMTRHSSQNSGSTNNTVWSPESS
ncbi:hypothetical protein H0G86_007875 [Trichoderma simmonsii]|uniref:Uncharacterized protein n=1 Tax=Trichoderma simmonsii TaxID=1491479 RepID=A0A8G0LEC2_9HYPO|nr:hypothetical protein H0G86_007875 [Trichoderma simmonsii]